MSKVQDKTYTTKQLMVYILPFRCQWFILFYYYFDRSSIFGKDIYWNLCNNSHSPGHMLGNLHATNHIKLQANNGYSFVAFTAGEDILIDFVFLLLTTYSLYELTSQLQTLLSDQCICQTQPTAYRFIPINKCPEKLFHINYSQLYKINKSDAKQLTITLIYSSRLCIVTGMSLPPRLNSIG